MSHVIQHCFRIRYLRDTQLHSAAGVGTTYTNRMSRLSEPLSLRQAATPAQRGDADSN